MELQTEAAGGKDDVQRSLRPHALLPTSIPSPYVRQLGTSAPGAEGRGEIVAEAQAGTVRTSLSDRCLCRERDGRRAVPCCRA